MMVADRLDVARPIAHPSLRLFLGRGALLTPRPPFSLLRLRRLAEQLCLRPLVRPPRQKVDR